MALKKLPLNIQSKFCASTQIKSFKSAVEELIYNAFDAESTSIAIRVHIQENYIQVVDNGHGVPKDDFHLLGQRYATSRYENNITKSVQKYGHGGQSLANIIEVSQSVKIISRCKNSDGTWMKLFYKGKGQECQEVATRPSIGTTVEIKGFLYNLTIQNKSVKATQELQNIKTFLEQMSLVHCNTSISLRDNLENEIIFKIHKNRDIYQTFSALLNIEKSNLQELQVEKNEYKVTGFILNNDVEPQGYQWIYANNKLIEYSNLHRIVNQNLSKSFPLRKKTKVKIQNNHEDLMAKRCLPDYIIFITCPCNDYDIIANPKESILEFKNSSHIIRLLEKLIKFHSDETNFDKKTVAELPLKTGDKCKLNEAETRNQIKLIINKILGSHQKKLSGSHLHNGVKGKMVKRKRKKSIIDLNSKIKKHNTNDRGVALKTNKVDNLLDVLNDNALHNNDSPKFQIPKKKRKENLKLGNTNKLHKRCVESKPPKVKSKVLKKDPVITKFEENTASVQKRCQILAKKVDNMFNFEKKRKCKVFTNEIVQYSNVIRGNKKLSIRKKMDEIIIHEYLPLVQKANIDYSDNHTHILKSDDLIRPVTTIVDQSIVQGHNIFNDHCKLQSNIYNVEKKNSPYDHNIPRLTYESHSYFKDAELRHTKEKVLDKYEQFPFPTRISEGDLALTKETENDMGDNNLQISTDKYTIPRKINSSKADRFMHSEMFKSSSYSIQFSETDPQLNKTCSRIPNVPDEIIPMTNKSQPIIGNTYTIINSDNPTNLNNISCPVTIIPTTPNFSNQNTSEIPRTYCVETINANGKYTDESSSLQNVVNGNTPEIPVQNNNFNVIFISNSQQSQHELNVNNSIEPLNICETVLECQYQDENEDLNVIFDSDNNIEEKLLKLSESIEDRASISHHKYSKDQDESNFKAAKELHHQNEHEDHEHHFNLKNRRRYIPKGMSQIFENCNYKNVCNYECDEDYFEETVYNNFIQNFQTNTEIFEPRIQNLNELATRDVERVNKKLSKDNSGLTFNGESLKQAKVLGQVDFKFIGTKIKDQLNTRDYLVLFDQHAVHERIRLEKNMTEYIDGDQWKSVALDGITLKLTKDEIVYLHNYRDKFNKLGLDWTVLDSTEVSVSSIPEAILGKHPRQVDVVLKAVKSLIKEEINMIKEQGGCVSLYPMAIMDLVFSEACRYAIMFGDLLSRIDCADLLNALSKCKTPFQCAHGRPVMAVLVEIETEKHEYKINMARVKEFRRNRSPIRKLNK